MIDEKWLNEKTGKYVCPYCGKEYTKKGIPTHIMRTHTDKEKFKNSGTLGMSWSLSKDYISPRSIKCQERDSKRVITPCEKCGNTPKEWFGSGRFCSRSCANSHVVSEKHKLKSSKSMKGRPGHTRGVKLKTWCYISFCKNCNKCFEGKDRQFCVRKCRSEFSLKNYDDLSLYRNKTQFKFSLNDYPDRFDFSLIEEYGWYKAKNRGDNQNGVSRDHIVSVRYGFDNNISTWIISHPANCQLKPHKENVSKGKKCDISLDELMLKIEKW